MAGIMKRFGDIMSANLNALLDKAEDPEKMVDQYLRNLESDLGKVKAETAAVMAEETKCKRQLDECNEEIAKMQRYAKRPLWLEMTVTPASFWRKSSSSHPNRMHFRNLMTLHIVML